MAEDSCCAYAVCFGAKEAIGKALTTGLVEINWDEIEINPNEQQPTACLYRRADIQARKLGIERWLLDYWQLEGHILVHAIALGKKLNCRNNSHDKHL